MARKGLTRERIVEEGCALVEERGFDAFSMRELAARLDVGPASLYNHVSGLEELRQAMALHSADLMRRTLEKAMEGKDEDERFLEGARAYRRFAGEHPHGYQVLIRMPASNDAILVQAAKDSFAPLRRLILDRCGDETAALHFLRCFRSAIHGFVELTANGFMRRGPATRDETYEVMIRAYLDKWKELCEHEKV